MSLLYPWQKNSAPLSSLLLALLPRDQHNFPDGSTKPITTSPSLLWYPPSSFPESSLISVSDLSSQGSLSLLFLFLECLSSFSLPGNLLLLIFQDHPQTQPPSWDFAQTPRPNRDYLLWESIHYSCPYYSPWQSAMYVAICLLVCDFLSVREHVLFISGHSALHRAQHLVTPPYETHIKPVISIKCSLQKHI